MLFLSASTIKHQTSITKSKHMSIFLCYYQSDTSKSAALHHSALSVGGIDQVIVYDDKHPLISTLKKKASTTLNFAWGYWKSYIIHYTLFQNCKEGDIVIYCDENYRFTGSVRPYVDALLSGKKDTLLFKDVGNAKQSQFCKQDCFDAMSCHGEEYMNAYEITSDFQIYRKTETSLQFVSKYVEFCSDPKTMDTIYRAPNGPDFEIHHHDQAVLTNLRTKQRDRVLVMELPVQDQDALSSILDTPPTMKIPRTVVVTPTTGTKDLRKCIQSVQEQTLLGVVHLIVVDGPEHVEKVEAILEPFKNKMPLHTMVLPFNAGANGWLGHRIYASMANLLDYDYIAYLDEDNFYDPDHLELMHKMVVRHNLDWTFSLRKIIDGNGNVLTVDNCESLGNMSHTVLSWDDFLVDTSCYFLIPKVAQAIAPYWMHTARNGEIEADRSVCRFLLNHPTFKGKGVPKYTLNYMVAQRSDSVQADFFMKGNAIFKNDFAAKPTVYIFLENEQTTQRFVVEPQPGGSADLVRGLASTYNLVNGYAMKHRIPTGSTVLGMMLKDVPPAFARKDLRRIVYPMPSASLSTASTDHVLKLFHIPETAVGRDVVFTKNDCPVAEKYMQHLKDVTAMELVEYENFTFALVGDSRDRMYDALMAGCIPIYKVDALPIKDVYIDLNKFKTSKALQKHLDNLSIGKIQEMRSKVLEKRHEVLRDILPLKFSERFDALYHKNSSVE